MPPPKYEPLQDGPEGSGLEMSAPPPPKSVDLNDDSDSETTFPPPTPPRSAAGHARSSSQGSHMATVAQKRALWWRNVVITGMFILSWWVHTQLGWGSVWPTEASSLTLAR